MSETIETSTGLGPITGTRQGSVERYMGVRFAEPPVGDLRFAAPVRSGAWEGVYDATTARNRAMQPPSPEILGPPGLGKDDEDCLFLNIFTPASDGAKRPVLCWIHGGSHTTGSGYEYDGSVLARQGDVVVVTVNYRLGVFGFLDLSKFGPEFEGSGANGVRDNIAVLEWIRDHIADFGGDQDNITIFGESAGGGSVLGLVASPSAEGLFHQAIAHSPGGMNTPSLDVVSTIADRLEGEGSDLDKLRQASADRLLEIQQEVSFNGGSIDGHVITRHPTQAVRERGAAGVSIILGSNRDEGTLFSEIMSAVPGMFEAITPLIATQVTRGADPTGYLAAMRERYPDDDEIAVGERAWVDLFRRSSVDAALAATEAGAGGWLYRFDIPTTVLDGKLGATHGGEIAFTFNSFEGDQAGLQLHEPTEAKRDVARRWSDTVIAFARTGDPNGAGLPIWPQYTAERRECLMLDAESRIESDPDAGHRELWEIS